MTDIFKAEILSFYFHTESDPKPTVLDTMKKFDIPVQDIYKLLKEKDGRNREG